MDEPRPTRRAPKPRRTRQFNMRVAEDVYAILDRAARDAHVSLATWLQLVGLQAAGEGVIYEQLARARLDGRKRRERGD